MADWVYWTTGATLIWKMFLGVGMGYLDVPVLASKPLTPEDLHPMCMYIAGRDRWYERRMMIKVDTLGGPHWIDVDKHEVIEREEVQNGT